MKKIDDFELDELVSGGLDGDEYRQALSRINEDPEGWKRCAVAFLEDQAFRKELGQLASSDEIWKSVESGSTSHQSPEPSSSPVAITPSRQLERFAKFTSIAALLLISFTVGWYGSGLRSDTSLPTDGTDTRVVGKSPIGNSAAPTLDPRMQRFDPTSRAGVQLVDDRIFPVDEVPSYIRNLERSGNYNIETVTGFVTVRDGNEIRLVPVQNLRVKPKGTSL
jgi:hypothetical protein